MSLFNYSYWSKSTKTSSGPFKGPSLEFEMPDMPEMPEMPAADFREHWRYTFAAAALAGRVAHDGLDRSAQTQALLCVQAADCLLLALEGTRAP